MELFLGRKFSSSPACDFLEFFLERRARGKSYLVRTSGKKAEVG